MLSPNTNNQYERNPLKIDIISIQSQVVYGTVGNNAAIPTLEDLGMKVASVPTVLFSNSPLYPTFYGGVIPDDWFQGYLTSLIERNALKHCQGILLGYLGSPSQAEILAKWLKEIRINYPNIFIQIDPVLGDIDSGLYVDERVGRVYKNQLCECANILTPNHFELEYLTEKKITTFNEAVTAARSFINETTNCVIVTSALPNLWKNDELQILIVTKDDAVTYSHPVYESITSGTGDVFSATLLTEILRKKSVIDAVKIASQRVVKTIKQTNLEDTNELVLIKE